MDIQYFLIGLKAVDIIILMILLYIFLKNFKHIRTRYAMGLIIFSFFFLIENFIEGIQRAAFWPPYTPEAIPLILFKNMIELVGLLALLWISWK